MKKNRAIEYAENLSHELMTPLAVIRSKVELLMQSENMGADEIVELDAILKTVGRMSRLNKSLILLSKIDNEVYQDSESIELLDVLDESLEHFEDPIRLKNLGLRFEKKEAIKLVSNRTLVEILLTNLIKNAVTHNVEDGFILFNVSANCCTITNSTATSSSGDLFARFNSGEQNGSSIGLGLSIVKKICDYLDFKVNYELQDEKFELTVQFPAAP